MNAMPPAARTPRRLSGRAVHAHGEFFRLEAASDIVLIAVALGYAWLRAVLPSRAQASG